MNCWNVWGCATKKMIIRDSFWWTETKSGNRTCLIMHPEVLLLDEITAALDPEMVREVLDRCSMDLAKKERTMVIVTHEMQFAKAVADRVTFLEGGKIVEEGDPKKLFEKPETDRLQRFLQTFTYEKAVK